MAKKSLFSILDKATGGKLSNATNVGTAFVKATPKQRQLAIDIATGKTKVNTRNVPKFPETALRPTTDYERLRTGEVETPKEGVPLPGDAVGKLSTFLPEVRFKFGPTEQDKLRSKIALDTTLKRLMSKDLAGALGKRETPTERLAFEQKGEEMTDAMLGLLEAPTMIGGKFARKGIQKLLNSSDKKITNLKAASEPVQISQPFNAGEYVKQLASKRDVARKAEKPGLLEKIGSGLKDIKSKLVDSNAPIEDAIAAVSKKYKFSVLPKADISHQIDRALRAPTLAGQFVKDSGFDTLIKSVDDIDAFDQYLIAKHAKNVETKGIKTGRDLVKDSQLVTELAPKYEAAAQKVNEFSRKLLDYSSESGLISKEFAEKLKTEYPEYVPLNRVFSELERNPGFGSSKSVASISKQSVVQKIKGSEREIESPIQSLLAKAGDAFVQGEKNKAAKILASYEKLPGFESFIKELPPGETAPHTFSFLDDGIKRTFETTKEIEAAAKALNVQQLNILGKILVAPVRIAKAGITGLNLPFLATNLVKDQIGAFVNSSKTVMNPKVFFKSFLEAVGHGKVYDDVVRSGGMGTSFDISRNQAPATLEKILSEKTIGNRVKYIAKNPQELLRAVENIIGRTEEATRLQQFIGTKNKLLKEGRTLGDANILAAKAARENTVNFFRKGDWGTVLNSAFLYLNAGIQGSRTFLRAAKDRPLQTATKVAAGLFFPTAVATMWNLNDPKRKEAYADIPDYEKQHNLIIIPPNPVKDENGNWNAIKIPLPSGISSLAIPIRRGIEQFNGLDSLKFSEVAGSIIGSVSPVGTSRGEILSTLTPQAIKPIIEYYTNQNLFTGRNQVPESMLDRSPEYQVRVNTSGTARKIGGVLDVSPIKVEEFIKGTFGGVGSQVLNGVDQALAGLDIIPRTQIGGKNVLDAIGARFIGTRGGETENKSGNKIKEILQKQADERFLLGQEAEMLYFELKGMPTDQAYKKYLEIKNKNPILFNKVKEVAAEEKLGLTYNDRLIKQLGVENGERAKFIYEIFNQMETKEDKAAYWNDLKNKKLISGKTEEQLLYLIKRDASPTSN